MKNLNKDTRTIDRALKWLVPPIALLALLAAVAGLWPGEGTPFTVTNFRGEVVTISAKGLYYWDTVSSAAQMQANDLVTLILGVPLLLVGLRMTLRGSLRGRLLLTGTVGFVLYTYITMCFGAAYNQLFLVYVVLFGLSLYAIVLSLWGIDLASLPGHFSPTLPRRGIAGLLFGAGGFLLLAWLGRIAATWSGGQPAALENVTSLFIQAMDLAVIVPLCFVSGVLLLRGSAWGYLLASISLLKFLTLGLAVSLMGLNMLRVGVAVSPVELGVFPVIALANLVMTVILLKNISESTHKEPVVL
ncbi:MAG: hypothetical protein KBG20_00490 [Caldilineaceae bacterium]|nr:hypothetical protein [Caldilineaceae bacterium]MBP8108109.1 hypothetical protein [Caldilineaceae bacterium]MBP8123089.1 hypothetical protein [Caldilineaceae bacterium]MBP9070736.1 hypothetical protein [Caldilineaceae bacterium]